MLLALLFLCPSAQGALTQEQGALLDQVFQEGLFDPVAAKAIRVSGVVPLRTCRGTKVDTPSTGWLIPKKGNQAARYVLNSLQVTDPPPQPTQIDFGKEALEGTSTGPSLITGIFARDPAGDLLVKAAWLRRLGHDAAAVKILRLALSSKTPQEALHSYRRSLAWSLFDHAVNAYMVREDADAVAALKRLLHLNERYLEQGRGILEDLKRRRKAGSFGRPPPPLPADFRKRPVEKRIPNLIHLLDEVDARQVGSPGEPNLDDQAILRELVACGEAAVPALLDCIEADSRWTRTVSYFRDYQHSREILPVKEVAGDAVMAILRLQGWRVALDVPVRLGEPGGGQDWVKHLRRLWEKEKDSPLPARMMRRLKSKTASPLARLEAAENLARLDREPSFSYLLDRWRPENAPRRKGLHPQLASFRNPTSADAILGAMDLHLAWLKTHDARIAPENPAWVEDHYLKYVADLADDRILPELRRRFQLAKHVGARRRRAFAAHRLGASGAIDTIATELADGTLRLPANDRPETQGNMPGFYQSGLRELGALVYSFQRAATPACEKALTALTRPGNRYHPWARDRMLRSNPDSAFGREWFTHPFGLAILLEALDDKTLTGTTIMFKDGRAAYQRDQSTTWREFPAGIDPTTDVHGKTSERICDVAAEQIMMLFPEVPRYHPLIKSRDERLKELRDWVDGAGGRYKRLRQDELEQRNLPTDLIRYTRVMR